MYQIVSIMRFVVLLGFFSAHAASEPTIQAPLPLAEESASQQIVKGYALKGMLTTVMALYPHLSPSKALLLSPLIAEMSRDWALNTYGTFELVPEEKEQADGTFKIVPGRLIQKFNNTTPTPLNKIARTLFNVADQVMAPTTQPSNPFLGLDANTVARMMRIVHSKGIQGLIEMLEAQCQAEQKPVKIKGKIQVAAPADDTVKQWYETYRAIKKSGKLTDLGRFKKALRTDFIPLLTALDTEAASPEAKEKNVEDFSKLLMIYTFFKDKAEGASNPAYSIPEYLKAFGSAGFKAEYETRAALERLDNLFKGKSDSPHLEPNADGVEQVALYLEDKIYGGVQALQTPYTTFKSTPITDPTNRFNGGEFPYCVEATIRSIINLILYDPVTGKLNTALLSTLAQESMDPEMKAFFEKYNDPLAPQYYQDTEGEWLRLVSSIENVLYKQDATQGRFEISGLPGSKNILAVLNHVFGRKAQSLEALATKLSENTNGRTIAFTPAASGYNLRVSDNTGLVAEGSLVAQEGIDHTAFLVKSGGFFDLLTSKEFIPLVTKMNEFLDGKEDLFRICFTDKTLHPDSYQDQFDPLEFALKNRLTEAFETMLRYETNPVDYKKLLYQAISSDSPEMVTFLLSRANLNQNDYKDLLTIAAKYGSLKLVTLLLSHVENPDYEKLLRLVAAASQENLELIKLLLTHVPNPDYNSLITKAGVSGSIEKIRFFLEKGANINGTGGDTTPLENALTTAILVRSDPEKTQKILETITFLIKNGAPVLQQHIDTAFRTRNADLVALLLPHLANPDYNQLLFKAIEERAENLVALFIDKGADVNASNPITLRTPLSAAITLEQPSIVEMLVQKGATINDQDILAAIKTKSVKITEDLINHSTTLRNHSTILRLSLYLGEAINSGSRELVEFFIKKGANLRLSVTPLRLTPLTAAISEYANRTAVHDSSNNNFDIIDCLIQNNAIITHENLQQAASYHTLYPHLVQAYMTQRFGIPLSQEEYNCIVRTISKAE